MRWMQISVQEKSYIYITEVYMMDRIVYREISEHMEYGYIVHKVYMIGTQNMDKYTGKVPGIYGTWIHRDIQHEIYVMDTQDMGQLYTEKVPDIQNTWVYRTWINCAQGFFLFF
jgi:hypothetical protein